MLEAKTCVCSLTPSLSLLYSLLHSRSFPLPITLPFAMRGAATGDAGHTITIDDEQKDEDDEDNEDGEDDKQSEAPLLSTSTTIFESLQDCLDRSHSSDGDGNGDGDGGGDDDNDDEDMYKE